MSESSPHIVILDEESALVDAFAARFAREGFQVTALSDFAIDPSDLLGMLPDLILLEIDQRFGQQGLHLLRPLRADSAGDAVQVLVSPTSSPIDTERYGVELRFLGAEVLPDPFDVLDLLAAAFAAVERAR